jgi:hypothetical protein
VSRNDLAAELERLAIRATDRSDGLVDFEGRDPAVFLFEVARALRDADDVIRTDLLSTGANMVAAVTDADASTRRKRDEAEAAEAARRDTREFLATPEARAVLAEPPRRVEDPRSPPGLLYAGKVLDGGDGVEGLAVSVLLPMNAAPAFPIGARVQLVSL